MKTLRFLIATLLITGSFMTLNSPDASASRVRTVPSATDQKKKDTQKSSTVKQPTTNTVCTQKNSNQTKLLKTPLWIGNGGTPK